MVKKALCLVFAFLFSINSFAAVVGDNDGSAFITKAEFDSLKNDFQAQIDSYNTNIDSKIDAAIASYLAGVKIEVATSLNTVLKDWDSITMRNYEIANAYNVPATNFNMTYYGTGHGTTSYERWPSAYGLAAVGTSGPAESQLKAVGLKSGRESDYNDLSKNSFYWTGLINDYEENIAMSKLGYNDYQDVANASQNIELRIFDIVKLDSIDNAYYASVDDFWDTIWNPLIQGHWYASSTSGGAEQIKDWSPTWAGGFFKWASKYKTDKITNKYELTWKDINQNVINPDWKNCFYTFTDNNKSSKDIVDAMTINKAGTWIKGNSDTRIPNSASGTKTKTGWEAADEHTAWNRVYLESHYNPSQLSASVYDWTRGATSGGQYDIPTLGGLGPISSSEIYLQKDNLKYTFKNTEYTKDITTMNDGFPLLYAKKDAKLTWESVFSEVKGSSAVEANGEVKIILSYGQFGDESASIANKYVQKDGTMGNTAYAWTTKDKTIKISWTMQEDGWIYAKWFPAALTSSTAGSAEGWSVTLDGLRSNKILFTENN